MQFIRHSFALAAALLLASCGNHSLPPSAQQANHSPAAQGADAFAPERGTGLTEQKAFYAQKFMAASANPLATEAGYEVLKRGGSAVDAMIAVQTTLGLVEPQSSGLGGGAFVVYWDNQAKKLTTFDARETAPAAATPQLFLDKDGKPLKFMDAVVGGRSVGTPGVPKLMEHLHKRYGKLAWKELFAKPIMLAEQGFKVSPRMAKSIEQNADALKRYPQTAAYFLPNGQPLQAGSLLKNQAFADSVKTLAAKGSAPFYDGEYAQNIVNAVKNAQDNPGVLAMRDFKNYKIIEREAVCADYRQYQVCGMGAPSSGAIAVGQILGILNQFDGKASAPDQADSWRLLGDASRLAFADRDVYVADPDFVHVPTKQLLSKEYLNKRAELLRQSGNALPEVSAGDVSAKHAAAPAIELPSTSHISIVDAQGNVLSMTTSIENAFGSTLMANGYLLNNELTDFAFEPEKNGKPVANRVEGGKRPRSSMAPTIVMENGRPYMAVGSPGGSRIIGYVAKTLVAHTDWGMDIQQAVSLPNMLNRFGTYELEENTAAAKWEQPLQQLGYKTQVRDLNSGVQAIVIGKQGLIGAADPRREGKVMGD
ncbi:gamma-glutamyltransferase [Conchiformibius kuhniae]|uniref:Glutathione hydrolase proenzyme n=1 Tax=Conchiformibius kuhniae TaxID=211502 RepID=A0ABD8B823_9NEIS|nr:gamma-glutamyltransferase [Conchiformibius kuhniae]